MTYDEALLAARAFLDTIPCPLAEYRWVVTNGRRIAEGWYFDFRRERLDGEPMEFPRDAAGGAPGYKVLSSSGEVQVVGWEEFHQLDAAG